MIGTKVTVKFERRKVLMKAKIANIQNLGHAGGAIRKLARSSIRKRPTASVAGSPPHSRKGQLKRAILYAVDKRQEVVVIGPDVEIVGKSGRAHELGGRFRRERYPKRPFMGPALEKLKDRLPKFWTNSVR